MQFIIKAYDGADTLVGIEGLDWQILVEADYIVNASENGYSRQNIDHFIENNMRTESGKRLARSVFCLYKISED